jgi:CRP-like cAMP-binding protein
MSSNSLWSRAQSRLRTLRGDDDAAPAGAGEQAPVAVPEHLRVSPLFEDISPADLAVLSLFMTRWQVAPGTIVVHQGEESRDLFIIEEGQAEVRLHAAGDEERLLATLGPGEYFGEIAFLTGERRNADVVARTPLTVLRLSQEGYGALTQMAVTEELSRTAQRRSAETEQERRRLEGGEEVPAEAGA